MVPRSRPTQKAMANRSRWRPNTVNGQDNPGGRQLNRRVEIFLRT
ncbi:hypothetical protein XAR_2190 [Xanthomonas citri pv. glycines str. 8ra]|nr:hypothetical protein XAR_2190 [Xanthomonas citri pv. glycines str. 8ra]